LTSSSSTPRAFPRFGSPAA